jgi:DNA-binding transcriptional regulator YiaG
MDGRCISQTELAQRWQLSESTLERWRAEGIGPLFLKLRGQVRYRDTDILAFEDQALYASTRYRAGAAPGHTADAQWGTLLLPAGPWQKLAQIAEGCGNIICATVRSHPISTINPGHESATALTGTQGPATLPKPTQPPPTPFWLLRGVSGPIQTRSEICCASPSRSEFMQTQATHAEPTTMFNETELASRWKISVRTLQDWRRRKTGPQFVKLQGWAVRYPLQAVIDFEEQSLRVVS